MIDLRHFINSNVKHSIVNMYDKSLIFFTIIQSQNLLPSLFKNDILVNWSTE